MYLVFIYVYGTINYKKKSIVWECYSHITKGKIPIQCKHLIPA